MASANYAKAAGLPMHSVSFSFTPSSGVYISGEMQGIVNDGTGGDFEHNYGVRMRAERKRAERYQDTP